MQSFVPRFDEMGEITGRARMFVVAVSSGRVNEKDKKALLLLLEKRLAHLKERQMENRYEAAYVKKEIFLTEAYITLVNLERPYIESFKKSKWLFEQMDMEDLWDTFYCSKCGKATRVFYPDSDGLSPSVFADKTLP